MEQKKQIAFFWSATGLFTGGVPDLNKHEDVRLCKHLGKYMFTKVPALENYTLL